jgi:septal ring factor EnvC (AmiA/AmiB activator)
MPFRAARILAFSSVLAATAAFAQQAPTAQQYEDALRQLQQAQDRKNQLADENAKLADENAQLKARLADLESSLRSAEASERIYFLRAHYAAWQTFMNRYPALLTRFQTYLGATDRSTLSTASAEWVAQPLELFDAEWPFSAAATLPNGATP